MLFASLSNLLTRIYTHICLLGWVNVVITLKLFFFCRNEDFSFLFLNISLTLILKFPSLKLSQEAYEIFHKSDLSYIRFCWANYALPHSTPH